MQTILVIALIGLIAQLIDGSLGMGYGVITTSLLLMYNITPSVASASVHIAKIFTTSAAGLSHWKFKNIHKDTALQLVLPGSIGAFGGACLISTVSGNTIKPFISVVLIILGVNIVRQFLFTKKNKIIRKKWGIWTFIPIGLGAGFLDAIGGGGWGPCVTPLLISRDELEMRKVIGTVDVSKFFVSIFATFGFILSMNLTQINWSWVFILILSGVVVAPFAAYLIRFIKHHYLGLLVGGLLLMTNGYTIMVTLDLPIPFQVIVYTLLMLALFVCLKHAHVALKEEPPLEKEKKT